MTWRKRSLNRRVSVLGLLAAASRSRANAVAVAVAVEPLERRTLLSANLVWRPQPGSNAWDYTTPNWVDTATNQPAVFHDGDSVAFDDSGDGGYVDIIGAGTSGSPLGVAPASVSFANDAGSYVVIGGPLGGSGGLTKDGTGDLSLSPDSFNTYAGVTDVRAGTLYLGVAAIPNDSALTIEQGATVVDNGQSALRNGTYATIGSIAGGGTLDLNNVQWPLMAGADNTDSTFSGAISGWSLIKIGAGAFTLAGDQPNAFHSLDIGEPATGGGAIDGGTVVLDKADGVTAVSANPGDSGDGIVIFSGKLLWAASDQLLPTESIVGRPEGPADIDLGNHTDSCYSLGGNNGGTFHIGTGGTLNVTDFVVSSGAPGVAWNIDQGGTLNLIDGGTGYANYRLDATNVSLNLSGTINIGNSSGVNAAIFNGGAAVVAATGTINTGSGAVVFQSNVTLPPDQNPPNMTVQSGGQLNIGRFGDDASVQFLGHEGGGAPNDPGSLLLEAGATLNLEGANATIQGLGNEDAINGDGTINLSGANRSIYVPATLAIAADLVNGTITKTGAGYLGLGGSNALDGATTVQGGLLVLQGAGALGGASHVYVDDGATLNLNGYDLAIPLDVVGSGAPNKGGALSNTGNDGTGLSGPGGPVTITGAVTLNALTAITGDHSITFAGKVTGPGGISLGISNFIAVLANAANDYAGGTTNADRPYGTANIEVAAPHALGTGPLHLDGSSLIFDSVTDEVTASSVSLTSADFGQLPNLVLNGPAPASSYTLINNTGTAPVAGTFNGLPQGASLTVGGKTFYINYLGGDGNDVVISTSPPGLGSIQGMVWVDFNNDGNVDFGEQGIPGVTITLTGSAGNVVAQTTTESNGLYTFDQVPPDVYTISEGANPPGYVEGKDTLGTITDLQGNVISTGTGNASVQDVFSGVRIGTSQNAINYNFGERPAAGSSVSKGQAATMGFWQNKNGQALILRFASIGPWLAATLPQTFGSLATASPQQVATLYQQQFVLKDKLDAQAMATALSVYATDASLGGSAAASYGFNVGTYGLGDSTWNVGADGAAFNVANNSTLTVLQILQDWDRQANKTDKTIRQLAIDVFGGINARGGI